MITLIISFLMNIQPVDQSPITIPPVPVEDFMDRLGKKAEANIELRSINKAQEANTATPVVPENASDESVEEKQALVETQNKIEVEKKELESKAIEKKVEKLEAQVEKSQTVSNWWDKAEEISATPDNEHKSKVTDYETKAKAFDEMLSDPLVEAIVTAKKAGKDPLSIIKDLQPLDVNAIPEERLYEMSLKNEGLNEEEVSTEMEAFKELTPLAKKRAVKEFRQELSKKDSEKLNKYITDNSSKLQESAKLVERYASEKSKLLTSMIGKDEMGIKITQSIASQLEESMDKGISLYREDGSIDVKKAFDLHLWNTQRTLIMKNAVAKARADAKEEILKEFSRPSKEDGSLKIVPDYKSDSQRDVELFRKELRNQYK